MKQEDCFVETVPCVHVGNGNWIPTEKVKFIDISEDFQGYDLMTFVYEGKTMTSRIATYPL
jgi:hypothetical protein